MDYVAIGYLTYNGEYCGIRLFNYSYFFFDDCKLDLVKSILQKGAKVLNLELINGEIVWTQGNYNRYPEIKAGTWHILSNENSMTIIGYDIIDGVKYYVMVNPIGTPIVVHENSIHKIERAGYKVTNCRIVARKGKCYLAPMSGRLPVLRGGYTVDYIGDGKIRFNIYNTFTNQIVIPERICKDTSSIDKISEIEICPVQLRNNIKKIIIKANAGVEPTAFQGFPELKSVEIRGNNIVNQLERPLFKDCDKLEYVYLNTNVRGQMFMDCKSLKKVVLGPNVGFIGDEAFKGCDNLLEIDMTHSNVTIVEAGAFQNCKSLQRIEFPRSLRVLYKDAFNGCNNLKEVVFKSPVFLLPISQKEVINAYKSITKDLIYPEDEEKKLFQGIAGVKVYCNSIFPVEHLKLNAWDGTVICMDNDKAKKKDRAKSRAKVFGLKGKVDNFCYSHEEILEALKLMDDKRFKQSLLVEFKNYLKFALLCKPLACWDSHLYHNMTNVVTDGIYFINVDFWRFGTFAEVYDIKWIRILGDYLVIYIETTNMYGEYRYFMILNLSKEKLIKYVEYMGNKAIVDDKSARGLQLIFERIQFMREVDSVYLDGDSIIIKAKTGEMLRVWNDGRWQVECNVEDARQSVFTEY